MAKPSKLPRWADGGTGTPTNTAEPLETQKDTGYVPGDKLPAQVFNYLLNLVHQWLTWFDGHAALIDAVNSFSAPQTFAGGSSTSHSVSFSPSAPTTRLGAGLFNLGGSPNHKARFYAALGQFEVAINAAWGGSTWSADDTSKEARVFILSADGDINVKRKAVTSSAWADTAWDSPRPNITYGTNVSGNTNLFDHAARGIDELVSFSVSGTVGAAGTAAGETLATLPAAARPNFPMKFTGYRKSGSTYTAIPMEMASGVISSPVALVSGDVFYATGVGQANWNAAL